MVEIRRIQVFRVAAVVAVTYVLAAWILFVGFFLVNGLASLFRGGLMSPWAPLKNNLMILVGILGQAVVCFIAVALVSAIYNRWASWFGGIIVDLRTIERRAD